MECHQQEKAISRAIVSDVSSDVGLMNSDVKSTTSVDASSGGHDEAPPPSEECAWSSWVDSARVFRRSKEEEPVNNR